MQMPEMQPRQEGRQRGGLAPSEYGPKQAPRGPLFLGVAALHAVLNHLCDSGIPESGDVSELATLGNVAQQPPHDLARTRFRQIIRVDEALRPCELSDLLGHVLAQHLVERVVVLALLSAALECHEG